MLAGPGCITGLRSPTGIVRAYVTSLGCRHETTAAAAQLRELENLRKIITRYEFHPQRKLLLDERSFMMARRGDVALKDFISNISVNNSGPAFFRSKCDGLLRYVDQAFHVARTRWITHAGSSFLPSQAALVDASQQAFDRIFSSLESRKLDQLAPLCTYPGVLDFHRDRIKRRLSERQRRVLKVRSDDLVGNGLLRTFSGIPLGEGDTSTLLHDCRIVAHSADGRDLDKPQFVYAVYLCALYKKAMIFDELRRRPDARCPFRERERVPFGYGFAHSRFVLLRVEFAHSIINAHCADANIDSTADLYDFGVFAL